MPIHYYLPKLEGEKHIKPPQKGYWENQDSGIFKAISDAIEVSQKAEDINVSSIPDVWARPLVFQAGLKKDSKSPLSERYKNEWRGLLSLLALAKYKYSKAVQVIPVQLDNGKLSTALNKLTPHREGVQLEKDIRYLWNDVIIIKYEDIPIGALSPTTLVFTATEYNERLKNTNLDLKDENGYLRPPVKGEENYELVGEWLDVLLQKLEPEEGKKLLYTEEQNNDNDITGNISRLLREWLKDIRDGLGVGEIDSKKVQVCTSTLISDPILENKNYHIYQAILCPLEKDVSGVGAGEGHSDISLAMKRDNSKNQYKEVVVITENLLKTKKRIWEPQDRGPIKLDDFHGGDAKEIMEKYFNKESGDIINIHGGYRLSNENAIWIRPEKYFLTDILLKGKSDNLLMEGEAECNGGDLGKKYILPFKKEILDYFSWEDIKRDLNPKYKEDGTNVIFSFSLPTKSGTEEIKKTYMLKGMTAGKGSDGTILELEVPVIEIFPNYIDKNWRRYYIFNGSSESVSVSPVTFDRYKPTSIYFEEAVGDIRKKIEIIEINADDAFPEGLELKKTDQYLGLILLQASEPHSLSKTWKIGVDFGTSNTNVYRQSSTSETAEKWIFDFPKYTRRVTASQDDDRGKLLQEYFVPTQEIRLPISTTLKIYTLARKKNLMLDYFIFFPSEYHMPHNVYSDIKWDVEGERKTEYFIESILFLLLIEACSQRIEEIEILCSYPKAFSQTDISILKGDWARIFNKMLVEPTRVINLNESINDNGKKIKIKDSTGGEHYKGDVITPFFETEGIAAGEYFGSEKTVPFSEMAKKAIAAICLDIGGGTSDISIWFENNIVYDASVTLAGRQMSRLFQRNRRLCEFLFSKKAAIALEEKKNEPTFFAARLNLILRNEEKTIQEMLVKYANEKDVKWLRQMLAIEFCALSFYTAMLTAAADKAIGGGLLKRVGEEEIGLHWGGNAAKFVNWLDFGKADKNGVGSKMLSAVYFNCVKDIGTKPNALAHFQSPSHKSEASGGLVVMDIKSRSKRYSETKTSSLGFDIDMEDQIKQDESRSAGVVCGEVIELSDRQIGFLDTVLGKDFFTENKTKFKSTTLERLIRYVDILNFFGMKLGLFTEDTKINLNDANKRNIRDKILSEFIKAQSLNEGQRLNEPIFIMEVKVLLDILVNDLK